MTACYNVCSSARALPRRRVPALTNDPPPLFQLPEALGPYRVRRVLASGTLGPRVLVEDDRGRLQVLKLISDIAADAPALADVLEHVRTQLPAHAGLLPVTDVGIADDSVYVASPLVDAPTVEGRLRGGRQTLDGTLAWLRPVVAGLQAAHDAGLWHGAIHPKDILVPEDGGVLTGVGVAPALEHLSLQAPIRVPYTAPERASGRRWDARADQYSLAMLVLDALSGRRLIAGTIPAFDRWTLAETPPEDARLHEVFGRALHPDADQRYGSLAEWLAALAGPERADAEGPLSRFARDGVIIALPASADTDDPVRAVELQSLEDPEGVALSLFPEEDRIGEAAPTGDVAVAEAAPLEEQSEPEQEWLVADVPSDPVPVEEPEPLSYRTPPTEHPPIDVSTVAAPVEAEWRLSDEDVPTVVEPPRSWDPPAEEPSRRPWLLVVVLLMLAAVGYGTWRSLHAPPVTTASDDVEAPTAPDETPQPPAAQAAAPPTEPSGRATPPDSGRAIVPQAPVQEAAPRVRAAQPAVPPAQTAPSPRAAAPPEVAVATNTGRALIRSSPSGELRVNGRVQGQTPVVLRDLPFGSYVIAISRPGFQTVERELTLLPSQPVASVSVDLVPGEGVAAGPPSPPAPTLPEPASSSSSSSSTPERAPAVAGPAPGASAPTGGLFVASIPASARLFVDGRAYGSTPAGIPGLTPGPHTVRVEAPGYRTWEGRVVVVAGSRARVQATLQQEQE